jgi:putative MFS transporter
MVPEPFPPRLHLYGWRDRTVIGLALASMAAGFGQFGVVSALGSVARDLGHVHAGTTMSDVIGLSGGEIGLGLALIRLASLGSLPLIGLADRFGRRPLLLGTLTLGLTLTFLAAFAPTYWWFVAIFACGRPLLSAGNGLTEVMAAEETSRHSRASAVALITAGYGIGAGLTAIIHSLAGNVLGFRGLFLLVSVPLVCLPLLARWIAEPDRFALAEATAAPRRPVLGAVATPFRRHLAIIATLSFFLSAMAGPANSFVFLYAQNILHQAGSVTALMVLAAAVTGLAGLLAGRWLADHLGRRPTGAATLMALGLCAIVTYSGTSLALVVGYLVGIFAGSAFAPAIGAITTELFPTAVRASAIGWSVVAGVLGAVAGLLVFGKIADLRNNFSGAALLTFGPAVLAAILFWLLPETNGKELEELWPDEVPAGTLEFLDGDA